MFRACSDDRAEGHFFDNAVTKPSTFDIVADDAGTRPSTFGTRASTFGVLDRQLLVLDRELLARAWSGGICSASSRTRSITCSSV